MNRFDDSCYDERYGSSFDEDRFNGNRFHSRRRSQSVGRRNSISRRYSTSYYDEDGFNERLSGYFYGGPLGMNSMDCFGGNRFMNMYPDYEYFGYDARYPSFNRFGYDKFASNNSEYFNYENENFNYDRFNKY